MAPFIQDNIYQIKNDLFNAFVGRTITYEDPNLTIQPIVGIRFDYTAHTKFEIKYAGDEVTMSIDGAAVGEHNNFVSALVTPGTKGDNWIVELEENAAGRFFYKIALARNPDLVWTLNLPTAPANRVHLQRYVQGNRRQLWELQEVPF